MTPHPTIGYFKGQIVGNIFDFRANLLIMAIIVTFKDDGIVLIFLDFSFFYQPLLFGTDAFEQYGRGLVVRILRDELTLYRQLQDRFSQLFGFHCMSIFSSSKRRSFSI